jgi:hypothetical protein
MRSMWIFLEKPRQLWNALDGAIRGRQGQRKDADPDIPILKHAKAEYEKLK